MTLARELQKGDLLILQASNGRTRARVQSVIEGTAADLLPPGADDPAPMLHVNVLLQRPLVVPDVPHWKTSYWTLHLAPDDKVELCQV